MPQNLCLIPEHTKPCPIKLLTQILEREKGLSPVSHSSLRLPLSATWMNLKSVDPGVTRELERFNLHKAADWYKTLVRLIYTFSV